MADTLTAEERLRFLNTIQRYLERDLSPQELADFNTALKASAAHRRLFLQYTRQSAAMLEVLGVQSFNSISSLTASSNDEPEEDWLASLQQDTGQASQSRLGQPIDNDTITAHQLFSLAGYVLGKALTTRRAYQAYAFAAMLILAVTLFLVFTGNEESPAGPPTATTTLIEPVEPEPIAPIVHHHVATLTDQRDAVWSPASAGLGSPAPDLTPGSPLRAGTRLTLTQGFAEITTNRGAVALIQAPATIELLNNDNALRLHAGKLVGICETESSKGFLVRTPHLDITDLGTRFGVDASTPGTTEVHVHQGEVIVAQPQTSGTHNPAPQRITANQAVRGMANTSGLMTTEPAFDRFDPVLSTYRLRSTGLHLPEGEFDTNWHVIEDANGPLDQPLRVIVKRSRSKQFGHFDAPGNDPDVAQWLFFGGSRSAYYPYDPPAGLDSTRLVLETSVHLPETISLHDKVLYLRYSYDEGLSALQINGQTTELPKKPLGKGGQVLFHEVDVPIEQTALRHGENTVQFDLPNKRTSDLFSFYLQWELRPASTDNTTEGEAQP